MIQEERRTYLIQYLLDEKDQMKEKQIPDKESEQRRLLRGLMNIRMPHPISEEFLTIQNEYLQNEIEKKGIVKISDLIPIQREIYLWQGDITRLSCDAIVNAANSHMLGCFCPNHGCIDNAIHTFSGVLLRSACADLMKKQGHEEPAGRAKITPAFNLPCKYVLHTVGPIVHGWLTKKDKELLISCYQSCLETAEENGIKSVAFCCISTGEFHFPNDKAAEIAVHTVKEYKKQTGSRIEVIFNVFKDMDKEIYRRLLTED